MFKNVGGKIRVVSIIFFVLMCAASFVLLVIGIYNAAMLGWVEPLIYGIIGAALGFVFSLISTYMLYGYGTLIKSCEDNARINAEILYLLRNGRLITITGKPENHNIPGQPAQPAQPAQPKAPVAEGLASEAPAEETFVDELTDASQSNEELVKRCPSCGGAVRAQANFCNLCGYKMK